MKAKTTDDVSSFDFFHLSSQEYDAIIKLYWLEAGGGWGADIDFPEVFKLRNEKQGGMVEGLRELG